MSPAKSKAKRATTPPTPYAPDPVVPTRESDQPDLNGVVEQDYLNWRHHPVSKVFLRFLMDYERQLAEKQVAIMRTSQSAPDAFTLGRFNGAINTVHQMIELKFDDMVAFYAAEEPEDTDAA